MVAEVVALVVGHRVSEHVEARGLDPSHLPLDLRLQVRGLGAQLLLPIAEHERLADVLTLEHRPADDRWILAVARLSMGNDTWRQAMSIQRALVIGAGSGVGKSTASALRTAGVDVLASGRERDATDHAEAAALLAEADPDLVVVAAGARPRMVSIEEQSWESFSAPWDVDVKLAFEVGRAILARPLRPGSTVVIVSSGAGVNPTGSPMSGGYAGAKRMQMFLAGYFQQAAEARRLGIRFVAVAPMQFLTGTRIGEAATAAYGSGNWPVALDPDGVARAILAVASGEEHRGETLGVTGKGVEVI